MRLHFCYLFVLVNFLSFAQNLDIDLLKKIHGTYTDKGGNFMRFVTNSDIPIALGLPTGLLMAGAIKKNPTLVFNGLESFTAQGISGVITLGLKLGIKRDRPFVTYPNDIQKQSVAGSYSFPSGHSSMAFATATSISLQYPKWYIIVPVYLWASGVGYSRMYLGVHYPSDVLIGAVIGTGSSLITHCVFKRIKQKWLERKVEDKL